MFALFAGVQVEPALRTLPDRVRQILQERTTFRTAGDGPCSWHVDRPRPERILSFGGRRLLRLSFSFRSRAGILVSVLPILAVGQKRLPENASFSAFGASRTRGSFVLPGDLVGGKPGVPPGRTLRLSPGQGREAPSLYRKPP